jgi:hypothetical protein
MFKIRSVVLFGVAFILAIGLVAAAYFAMKAPVPSGLSLAANPVNVSVPLPPVKAQPINAQSVYMSDQALRRMLDQAYDYHQISNVQALLGILNGRYEHRCCGLPR